jgi:hypothetical protein
MSRYLRRKSPAKFTSPSGFVGSSLEACFAQIAIQRKGTLRNFGLPDCDEKLGSGPEVARVA